MPFNNRHFIIITVILLAAIGVVLFLNRATAISVSSGKFTGFPTNIGQWQGVDLPVEEKVLQILRTQDVLVREYKDAEGNSVYLAIVYSQGDRAAFHPPELCYLGGGVQLINKTLESFTLSDGTIFKTNTLTMKNDKSLFKAWFWFAAGHEFTANYYQQQLKLLYNWCRYRSKQGALIRVSAALDPANIEESQARVKHFIQEVVPIIEKFLKKT